MDIEMNEEAPRRGPGRPPKAETIQRSAIRAEPIRTRKRKGGQLNDPFKIDNVPDGVSYEWKRHTVFGKSDPSYDILMREQGWEPVDVSRHPELMPDGHKGPIIRDGLILMERPIELTMEARAEDRAAAMEAIEIKKQQMAGAPPGTMTRDHPGVRPSIRTSYESLPIDE